MGKHDTSVQVDTTMFTDDIARPMDELVVTIYNVARVTLDEAKAIANQLVTAYELIHKADDVTINRNDIDADAFESILAGLVTMRDHNGDL